MIYKMFLRNNSIIVAILHFMRKDPDSYRNSYNCISSLLKILLLILVASENSKMTFFIHMRAVKTRRLRMKEIMTTLCGIRNISCHLSLRLSQNNIAIAGNTIISPRICSKGFTSPVQQSRKMTTKIYDIGTPIIPISEARRFVVECMLAKGVPRANAEALGDLLAEADYRGHYSHGMNRLEMYVKDIEGGLCDGVATPEILKETCATAWVDGRNGLGAVVGKFCMDLAIKKAKDVGVGWVVAKESNHYGIAGMYALQAIKEGMIGFSCTNTSPLMAPTRARGSALGTNPISLGAPAENCDSFVLDMATTAVAVGKIEIAMRKKEPIPEGWAQDGDGNITTNAEVAYGARRLMPLGGAEINSGYKGTGLGMLVEIFCGIAAGSAYGPNVRQWGDSSRKADLGQCFVAVDPGRFAPGFEGRMSDLMGHVRCMEPADPALPVLVAGDPERMHMASVDENGGVRYVQDQHDTCAKLAKSLGVKPLKPCCK